MKNPHDKLAKFLTNCSGYMTKMAVMPIYDKPFKKSSEPESQWPWDFVCSTRDVGHTKVVQMMIIG